MIIEFNTRAHGPISFFVPDAPGKIHAYLGVDDTGKRLCADGRLSGQDYTMTLNNAQTMVERWHRKRLNRLFMSTANYAG